MAQARARGETELAKTARRAADHVCAMFGEGGIESVCGHPVIETALVELARLTGEQRYLDQAALFITRRGQGTLADSEFGRAYYQDDVPVRDATVLRGHAVRALYLASGAVDVAVETGDEELLAAVVHQWETTVARRTYLTGGMGSHHRDESFGDDFVLPPDRAYSETCAGVASVMLSWRLLLATGEPRFADFAERTLFNVIAASPAEDGRSFFYANTLHRRRRGTAPAADTDSPRAESSLRAPWFAVSCCPTNVARTLAVLPAYLATTDDSGIQLHQYADAEITTGGIALRIGTDYPYDGQVTIRVDRAPDHPWTLSLRVPAWAEGAQTWLTDPDGNRRGVATGTTEVTRVFHPGDEIRLELPVQAHWLTPDPRIDAIRGTAAVQRGPVVYCAESVDLPGDQDVDAIRVDPSAAPEEGEDGSVTVGGELTTPPTPLAVPPARQRPAGRGAHPHRAGPVPLLGEPRPVHDAGVAAGARLTPDEFDPVRRRTRPVLTGHGDDGDVPAVLAPPLDRDARIRIACRHGHRGPRRIVRHHPVVGRAGIEGGDRHPADLDRGGGGVEEAPGSWRTPRPRSW